MSSRASSLLLQWCCLPTQAPLGVLFPRSSIPANLVTLAVLAPYRGLWSLEPPEVPLCGAGGFSAWATFGRSTVFLKCWPKLAAVARFPWNPSLNILIAFLQYCVVVPFDRRPFRLSLFSPREARPQHCEPFTSPRHTVITNTFFPRFPPPKLSVICQCQLESRTQLRAAPTTTILNPLSVPRLAIRFPKTSS